MRVLQRLTSLLRTAGLPFVSTDGLYGSKLFGYAGPIRHEVSVPLWIAELRSE